MHSHLILKKGESLLWSAWSQRGDENTRPSAGHLFVTDKRIAFRPTAIERFAGEQSWECAIDGAEVAIRPGDFVTRVPVLRSIALQSRVTVSCGDYDPQNFWFIHSEEWLRVQFKDLPVQLEKRG